MRQLFPSDNTKFQFVIQYVLIFPPTNNRQRTIKFTFEVGSFEIENTFLFQAVLLWLLLVCAPTAAP